LAEANVAHDLSHADTLRDDDDSGVLASETAVIPRAEDNDTLLIIILNLDYIISTLSEQDACWVHAAELGPPPVAQERGGKASRYDDHDSATVSSELQDPEEDSSRPDSQPRATYQIGSNLLSGLARAWLAANGEVSIRPKLIASAILLDCLMREAAYVENEGDQVLILSDGKSSVPGPFQSMGCKGYKGISCARPSFSMCRVDGSGGGDEDEGSKKHCQAPSISLDMLACAMWRGIAIWMTYHSRSRQVRLLIV
jgi:hypothetical protein